MKRKNLLIGGIVVSFVAVLFCIYYSYTRTYETTDINNYGTYIGNFDNETPRAFIQSFFPDEISTSFSNVTYRYFAKKGDTYAYECYLEFVIEDQKEFNNFLNTYVDRQKVGVFSYDTSFMEYSISNVLYLHSDVTPHPISYAEIGKILYSDAEHRIIFVAIGVHDGGNATTSDLNSFFGRFHIDPLHYQESAYFSHEDQNAGIQFNKRFPNGELEDSN